MCFFYFLFPLWANISNFIMCHRRSSISTTTNKTFRHQPVPRMPFLFPTKPQSRPHLLQPHCFAICPTTPKVERLCLITWSFLWQPIQTGLTYFDLILRTRLRAWIFLPSCIITFSTPFLSYFDTTWFLPLLLHLHYLSLLADPRHDIYGIVCRSCP